MVTISRATVSDRREFYMLEARCFDMKYDDAYITYYWTPILIHQYCLKAVIDGRIVGGLITMPTYDKEWYLNSLFIDPEFRRMGIARKLFLQVFKDMWLHDVILDVRTDRPYLVEFYHSLGFEITGHSINHYGDSEDRFHMKKYHNMTHSHE